MLKIMRLPGKPSGWVLAGLCGLSVLLLALGERSRCLCHYSRQVLVLPSRLGAEAVVRLRGRVGDLSDSTPSTQPAHVEALNREIRKKRETIEDLNRRLAALRHWDSILRRPVADPANPGAPPVAWRCKLIDANIIGGEGLPAHDRKHIDRGARRGVAGGDLVVARRALHEFETALPSGLTVLGRSCVVGEVHSAAGYSATIRLVTDRGYQQKTQILRLIRPGETRSVRIKRPDGSLDVRPFRHTGRSKAPATVGAPVIVTAEGSGKGLICHHVPEHHDIRAGDVLATEPRAALPFRLDIGRVLRTETEPADPHFVTVHVAPLADLSVLQEVYIVLPIAARSD